MALAIVGLLAAFVAVGVSPGVTEAQDTDPPAPTFPTPDPTDDPTEPTTPTDTPTETPTPEANIHATMPTDFDLDALDNGVRLNWGSPMTVADDGRVVGYQIDRDAYDEDRDNPINDHGDTQIKVDVDETPYRDLGLAYETTYTYKVRAIVEYTDDTMGYGAWSRERSITTAESGGRLEALLDRPSAVRNVMADPACANSIVVRWTAPMDAGTAPAIGDGGVYVGPDYIGGRRAGKEEVGEPATISGYQVLMKSYMTYNDDGSKNDGSDADWVTATRFTTDLFYTDNDVAYGYTYEYAIRAQNSAGLWGPWMMVSEDLDEPPQPLRPISPVAKHEVDDAGNSTIVLNWDAPDDRQTMLWRDINDIGPNNMSIALSYRIERRIGEGSWETLAAEQPHQYIPGETPASAIQHFHKQKLTDDDRAAVTAESVKYRVSALVDQCNQSDWISVDEVSGTPQLTLGTIGDLTLSASLELTWTPAANAASQIAIVVNAADDTDYCLAPLSGSDSSYTCSDADAAAGSAYVGLVIALDGQGGSTVSNFPVQIVQ
jgi:hypothetical protein